MPAAPSGADCPGSGHGATVDLTRTDAYAYLLPADRIARYPAERRDHSRLLVMPRASETIDFRDLRFDDLPTLFRPGDVLVVNESRVMPVRLLGRKPTGARCEILLLRPMDPGESPSEAERWEALVRPGSKLKPGREVVVSDHLRVHVEGGLPGGARAVRLETDLPIDDAIAREGRVPLPPYLEREDEGIDRERYQTVYARVPGSVAAPTAGLHFTDSLLDDVRDRGVEIASIHLHVGPGTFRPVDADTVLDHEMHREAWAVSEAAAGAVNQTRDRGGRVWAVGTTVVRTLESAMSDDGRVTHGEGSTDLFITPGCTFRAVDALITNFHLPRSTLLMLVAAFAGYDNMMRAYSHAVRDGYRFYSYGDAMAILPRGDAGAP